MLASTVQFSNNNQPPTTPPSRRVHWGRQPKTRTTRPHPQTPNNVPDQFTPTASLPRPHRGSTRTTVRPNQPNSQRSTHEQTTAGHAPA